MSENKTLPKSILDMIGQTMQFSGGIFSHRKFEKEFDAKILAARFGSAIIMDVKNRTPKHPTVEFLIKNDTMKKSRWTRGFPIREIEIKDEDL